MAVAVSNNELSNSNEQLEKVDNFVCLRAITTGKMVHLIDIQHGINGVAVIAGKLGKNVTTKEILMMIEMIFRAVFLFGLECWTVKND